MPTCHGWALCFPHLAPLSSSSQHQGPYKGRWLRSLWLEFFHWLLITFRVRSQEALSPSLPPSLTNR